MEKAFRLSYLRPRPGTTVKAFKTRREMKRFVRLKGGLKGLLRYWEIRGIIEQRDGAIREAILMKVSKAKRIR